MAAAVTAGGAAVVHLLNWSLRHKHINVIKVISFKKNDLIKTKTLIDANNNKCCIDGSDPKEQSVVQTHWKDVLIQSKWSTKINPVQKSPLALIKRNYQRKKFFGFVLFFLTFDQIFEKLYWQKKKNQNPHRFLSKSAKCEGINLLLNEEDDEDGDGHSICVFGSKHRRRERTVQTQSSLKAGSLTTLPPCGPKGHQTKTNIFKLNSITDFSQPVSLSFDHKDNFSISD